MNRKDKVLAITITQLKRVHRDMNDCANKNILKDAIDQLDGILSLTNLSNTQSAEATSNPMITLKIKEWLSSDKETKWKQVEPFPSPLSNVFDSETCTSIIVYTDKITLRNLNIDGFQDVTAFIPTSKEGLFSIIYDSNSPLRWKH